MARSAVATEDFAGTGALSGSWTVYINNVTRAAGVASPQSAADNGARRNSGTYNNNQYSSLLISTVPTGGAEIGCTARDNSTAGNMNRYGATSDCAGYNQIYKHVNHSYSAIGTGPSTTYAQNDRVEIEVEGTSIRQMKNGSTIDTETDSSHSSGYPGFNFWLTAGKGDDWEGGDLVSATGIVTDPMVFQHPLLIQ